MIIIVFFVSSVSSGAGGVPFAFLNGLEISSQTGIIYFTDSSSRWGRRHVRLEVRERSVPPFRFYF